MGYSGNNPKLTMIHDRELIYDAEQQLHGADKAYKKSPANYGTEHSSPVAMTDAASYRSKMAKHWSASNSRFDMPIMHDEAGRKGEGSPNMMISPLNRSVEKLKEVKSDMQKNRDDKKMGVKRYNKKVGRLNKKIKRKETSTEGSPAMMNSPLHESKAKAPEKELRKGKKGDMNDSKIEGAIAKGDKAAKDSRRKERNAQASKKTSSINKEATAASIKTKSTPQSDEAAKKSKEATKTTKSTPQSEGDKQRAVRAAEIKSGARDEMGYQTS